jgi:hypothetical protein
MSDTQKQALQRFIAGLIASLIAIAVAALQSQEFRDLVVGFFGGDGILTGLILAAIGPIVLWIGKLRAGPTAKVADLPDGVRGATPKGSEPGLFG